MPTNRCTPGPWKIEPVFIAQQSGGAIHFGEYRFPHQAVDGHSREYPRGEAFANARLMESALDLLLALQNLSYYEARISPPPYGHNCRWCGDCVQRAKDEARAAIKKGEGI